MQNALDIDPDLASIARETLFSTFRSLFIASGCDYIPFFSGIGKAAFLNTFYQYADFITGKQGYGHLSDIDKEVKGLWHLSD